MDQTSAAALDRDSLSQRLESLRLSLRSLASTEPPLGLTEPDPGGSERWEAAQVWAHLAEFVGYWHAQLAMVIRSYDGTPVPFGRTKTDEGRIGAIETGRRRPISELAAHTDGAITALEDYLRGLDAAAWKARGVHPTRGVLDVSQILERFVTSHLEEHIAQLEGLGAG